METPNSLQFDLSRDRSVWNAWINYYSSCKSNTGFCFVRGEIALLSEQHPAKIRNTGDKAKIISANDTSGFTYRGRFTSDKEACTIGFDVSQKAHNALRWLIQRQGFRDSSGLAFVAWAVSGHDIPAPFWDTDELFNATTEESKSAPPLYTAENIGIRLSKMIAGYSTSITKTDRIIVMGVDSATTGRLAVIYYRELTGSDFLNRTHEWQEQ